MNYSRKKSDGVLSKLFSGLIRSVIVTVVALIISASPRYASEEPDATGAAETEDNSVMTEVGCVGDEEAPADEGFIKPVDGVLTSSFGERWGRRHNGIDIGADAGSGICAAADGVVTFAGYTDGYGNYVALDHGNGFESAYAHCSSIAVSCGETVTKGQIIAYVGSTGNSTGPHLHFELKLNGEFRDPLDYVVY